MSVIRKLKAAGTCSFYAKYICLFFVFTLSLQFLANSGALSGQESESASRILLLDFSSEQCPACQIVKPLLAELQRKNYPIRRVDAQNPADQELYARYNITTMPSYVILLDGEEADRFISQGEGIGLLKPQLLRMFDQTYEKMKRTAPAAPAEPIPTPMAQTAAEPVPPTAAILPGMPTEPLAAGLANEPTSLPTAIETAEMDAGLMAATVRIRAGNGTGTDCGTGTLIHSNTNNGTTEGLVLTCGHLFREGEGKGPIEVELFDPATGRPTKVIGECVWYDDDLDIGFVGVPLPGPVKAARMVPPGYLTKTADPLVSVGCTGGETPTLWKHTVVSTDSKFHQPKQADSANQPFYYIEVNNAPKQGRSGGGLFTRGDDGEYYLVGLCNAGDPETNEGYFLPSSVIYRQLLSNRNLAFVYEDLLRAQSGQPEQSLAANEPSAPNQSLDASPFDAAAPNGLPPELSVATASEPARLERTEAIPAAINAPAPLSSEPAAAPVTAQAAVPVPLGAVDSQASPVGFEGAPRYDSVPAVSTAPSAADPFTAAVDELRRRHADGAEIICIVSWPNAPGGPKESEVIRLNPTK